MNSTYPESGTLVLKFTQPFLFQPEPFFSDLIPLSLPNKPIILSSI